MATRAVSGIELVAVLTAGLTALVVAGCGAAPRPAATGPVRPSAHAPVQVPPMTVRPARAGTTTATTPSPRPTAPAAPGSTDPRVVATQLRLGLPVDGVYGRDTRHAVAAFQRSHGLTPTGRVDSSTWAVLRTVANPCPAPAIAPITTAPGRGKTVALTFDDGASPYLPRILAVLARHGVHATFFDTGLGDAAYPRIARKVVAAGDVLGNHTFHHLKNWGFAPYFSPSTQQRELTRTNSVQTPVIGHSPCLMRPPGGAYDPASLDLVRSLGMSLVMWTTSAEDWRQPPYLSRGFEQRILRNVEAGAALAHPIILMHTGKASHEPDCRPSGCTPGQVSSFRGNTVAVLPAIIKFFRARGYRFVTL